MARNEDKAKAMLNLFLRRHEVGRIEQKRPVHTSLVNTTAECEKWREHITKEIVAEVTAIQASGLSEGFIRDKNDYINKLLREKQFWELRIIELAGVEYAESINIDTSREKARRERLRRQQEAEEQAILAGTSLKKRKFQAAKYAQENERFKDQQGVPINLKSIGLQKDFDGAPIIEVNGYYYFGAAKNLPGVRELYELKQAENVKALKRGEILSRIDAAYYGYHEDDNMALLRQEEEYEKRLLQKYLAQETKRKADKAKQEQAALQQMNDGLQGDDGDNNNANNNTNNNNNNMGQDQNTSNQHTDNTNGPLILDNDAM